jgi:hypothetical protein
MRLLVKYLNLKLLKDFHSPIKTPDIQWYQKELLISIFKNKK